MLKLGAAPGKAAIMAVPDYQEFFEQIPANSNFVNKAPASTTIKYAKLSPKATIREYECGHFSIYSGDYFEKAIIDYIEFLDKIAK